MARPITWFFVFFLCTCCCARSWYCDYNGDEENQKRKDIKISTSAISSSPDFLAITDKTVLGQNAPGINGTDCAFEITCPEGKRVVAKFKVFRTQNARVHVFDGSLTNFVPASSDEVGTVNTFVAEASRTLLLSGVYASTRTQLTISFYSGATTKGHGGIAVEFYTVPDASTVQYLLKPPYGSQAAISWDSYGQSAKSCNTRVSGYWQQPVRRTQLPTQRRLPSSKAARWLRSRSFQQQRAIGFRRIQCGGKSLR